MRINSTTFSYPKESTSYATMETPIISIAKMSKINNVEEVNIHISKLDGQVLCSFKYAEDIQNKPMINTADPVDAITDVIKEKNIPVNNTQDVQEVVTDFKNNVQNITPQQLVNTTDPNKQDVRKNISDALRTPITPSTPNNNQNTI